MVFHTFLLIIFFIFVVVVVVVFMLCLVSYHASVCSMRFSLNILYYHFFHKHHYTNKYNN